jgi:pimeloyl-ACP methyl ester carboxylesterase
LHIQEHFYFINQSKLHFIEFGEGSDLLIAFHGFGDDCNLFLSLNDSFGKKYKIISVSLPFHGKSEWEDNFIFTKKILITFIESLSKQFSAKKYSLLGYSIGARLVLNLLVNANESIDRIFLIAPDGLKKNYAYEFVVYNKLGKFLFRKSLENHNTFLKIIKVLTVFKLLPKSRHKFLSKHLEKEERRFLVYNSWLSLRGMEVTKSQINLSLHKNSNIKVNLFFGKYDEVIPLHLAYSFKENLVNVELSIIDKGHYMIKEYLNQEINKVI